MLSENNYLDINRHALPNETDPIILENLMDCPRYCGHVYSLLSNKLYPMINDVVFDSSEKPIRVGSCFATPYSVSGAHFVKSIGLAENLEESMEIFKGISENKTKNLEVSKFMEAWGDEKSGHYCREKDCKQNCPFKYVEDNGRRDNPWHDPRLMNWRLF